MIYIHDLKDLNLKSADIESTYLLREIKQKARFPLSEQLLLSQFSLNFVSKLDLEMIEQAIALLPELIKEIQSLPGSNEALYESVGIQRSCATLAEMEEPLKNNIAYVNDIFSWQETLAAEMTLALNAYRNSSGDERKILLEKVGLIFEKLLRNKDRFGFEFNDVVGEAQLKRMTSLDDSMNKGFIIHTTIEEHLRKDDFARIRKRIPAEELAKIDSVIRKTNDVKKAIERAYDANMRMVLLSVLIYTYFKFAQGV